MNGKRVHFETEGEQNRKINIKKKKIVTGTPEPPLLASEIVMPKFHRAKDTPALDASTPS